jgi:hypothetical protein
MVTNSVQNVTETACSFKSMWPPSTTKLFPVLKFRFFSACVENDGVKKSTDQRENKGEKKN